MQGSEVGKYRTQDLIRQAEAYRLSKATRVARAEESRGRGRRLAHALASTLLWPVRH